MASKRKYEYVPETETDTEDFFCRHNNSSYQYDSQPIFKDEEEECGTSEKVAKCEYSHYVF